MMGNKKGEKMKQLVLVLLLLASVMPCATYASASGSSSQDEDQAANSWWRRKRKKKHRRRHKKKKRERSVAPDATAIVADGSQQTVETIGPHDSLTPQFLKIAKKQNAKKRKRVRIPGAGELRYCEEITIGRGSSIAAIRAQLAAQAEEALAVQKQEEAIHDEPVEDIEDLVTELGGGPIQLQQPQSTIVDQLNLLGIHDLDDPGDGTLDRTMLRLLALEKKYGGGCGESQ